MSQTKKKTSFTQAMECARALSNQTLVRPREAAAILSISRKHLYALASRPDFPERIRVSDRVVAWRVSDLEQWIARKSAPLTVQSKGGSDE